MKVRASVKPICEKCKVIKRKGAIINRDRDKTLLPGSAEFGSEEYILDFVVSLV